MEHHTVIQGENNLKEYIKFGLVLVTVIGISLWLNSVFGEGGGDGFLRWFMGVFFIVFATFKLIGYEMFAMMFAGYDVVAKRFKAYAYAYPFIELGLGVLYVLNAVPRARDIVTIFLMTISLIGVTQELKKRSGIHCACLGNVIKLPLSTVSFIEDAGMGIMAVFMLILSLAK